MIVARAPVRISFFGGGTDYPEHFTRHGGAVLATAIDKYSYTTASRFPSEFFDYSVRIQYREVESVARVDDLKHVVFRECLRYCHIDRDIELHNVANLPAFTGLGSSSTFTVSLLQALHAFKGEFVSPMDLAYEAIHVERHLLHDHVGCQDQTTAALGGFNLIEFRTESDMIQNRVQVSRQRLAEFEQRLILVYTGITRKASTVVAQQLGKVNDNKPTLLRMRQMVDEGWNILHGAHSLDAFGTLLHEAWAAKRSLDRGVSNPEIDALYECGRAAGALGGKLLGAGGGGFFLFFVRPEDRATLRQAFTGRAMLDIQINAPGAQVIFADTEAHH